MDWIETSGEEMYISNYPPENMKLKIQLFSIPPKSSDEEPVSFSKFFVILILRTNFNFWWKTCEFWSKIKNVVKNARLTK